jgi:hypothetical protein
MAMVDRYPRYISITAELYALKRIFDRLLVYLQAQDDNFREHPRYRFIEDIQTTIVNLRFEMDEACLPLFGEQRYDEHLAQNTQIHNPKLDPLIELVVSAEKDYLWRQRLIYFADRLEAVGNDCLLLAGEVRCKIAEIVERLKTDFIVRLKQLAE